MKIALALYGSGEKGKTTTLNLLIDLITSDLTDFSMPVKTENELQINQRICMEFRGLKVGICTWGDNEEEVNKNCNFFESQNCNFIITATRSKGGSCKAINDYCIEKGFALQWIPKTVVAENQYETNLVQAQKLMKYI